MKIGIVTEYYYPLLGGISENVHNTKTKLEAMGHVLRARPGYMALINAIRVTPRGIEGVSDPRTLGAAVGF